MPDSERGCSARSRSRALVLIPATSFEMGSSEGADDERPIHRVDVSAFEIAVCTVTNAEWSRFADVPSNDLPVVGVSWFDAMSYCEWLRATTGLPFRLPTEAEWECAARGGVEGARYPWGDEPIWSAAAVPPLSEENRAAARLPHSRWANGPEPVGRTAPNGYGLYDVCTNVHEWCSDWYGADYYALSPAQDPRGPVEGTRRVSRGGSWRHHVKVSRCAARSSIPPEFRYADYGFRVACDGGR
jgi:formylglycine-generating enzyme